MPSPTVNISSPGEFAGILKTSTILVVDFYADWCGPCKAIAPTFESLSVKYSKPKRIVFAKVDTDKHQSIAGDYGIRAMPTFIILHSGIVVDTVKGANSSALYAAVEKAVKNAGPVSAYSTPGRTLGSSSSSAAPAAGTSLSPSLDVQRFIKAIVAFFALYFTTLFTLDAQGAAEKSPFKVDKEAREREDIRTRSGMAQGGGRTLG